MTDTCFRYAFDYTTKSGEPIGSIPFDPDWLPAREWASWEAVRQGLAPTPGGPEAFHIVPVWDELAGPPVMSAACVEDSSGVAVELDLLAYFRSAARERSADLVDRGWIQTGTPYLYRVCAYAREPDSAPQKSQPEGLAFDVEEAPQPLLVDERSLDAFVSASRAIAAQQENEMPVFIPRRVMAEASAQARAAGGVETGGILLGNLHRSRDFPRNVPSKESEVFLEVTAMIPATNTMAESQRLTFTPETWAAAGNAVELRKSDEIQVGWFHFHPRFCSKCPAEAQQVCAWGRPFFSGEDVHMHRTIFPRAFHIALLLSDLGDAELDASLFGWNRGVVTNRGFQILEAQPEPSVATDSNEQEVDSK